MGEAKGCPDEARDRLRGQRVWPAGGAVWGAVWPVWLAHRDAFLSWSSSSLVSSPFLYKSHYRATEGLVPHLCLPVGLEGRACWLAVPQGGNSLLPALGVECIALG